LSRNNGDLNGPFLACEQALWSEKERRKERARTSEETGRGWGRKEGKREGREPVDKGLKPPFRPLVIDLSSIVCTM